jgi:hypothetical protein
LGFELGGPNAPGVTYSPKQRHIDTKPPPTTSTLPSG